MDYPEEVIDLAISLFFEKHKELKNYNSPEVYELEENGCIDEALRILREKEETIGRIVFVKELIPKIQSNEVTYTFRSFMLKKRFYQVYCSRFRPCRECPHCTIEIINASKVFLEEIADEQARKAGIDSAKELVSLLQKWYRSEKQFWRHEFILRG